jgi:PLP dependent protein
MTGARGGPNVSESDLREKLAERIKAIEARIRAACARSGRQREDVRLLAVTKSVPDGILRLLPDLGLDYLGENRPQELWRKAAFLAGQANIRWHLIGHLQRNKIERTLPLVSLIHSVDSLRLLQALDATSAQNSPPISVLLEVNTSGETTKQGFTLAELPGLVPHLETLQSVHVTGLMTMAAPEADPRNCRPCFSLLRRLRDELASSLQGRHSLNHLSMGMSNDFEVAIEEGATLVRIGSALFEGFSG